MAELNKEEIGERISKGISFHEEQKRKKLEYITVIIKDIHIEVDAIDRIQKLLNEAREHEAVAHEMSRIHLVF